MTETIDDRLSKLKNEFEKMLGKPTRKSTYDITVFGFTSAEAEAWLESVEDYPHDIIKRRDNKLTEDSVHESPLINEG